MKTTGAVSPAEFKKKCEELDVRITLATTENGAGMHGDEYYVWHRGKKELMKNHVWYKNHWDPEKIMRIYFFWDDDEDVVVVCWLPSHLTTQKS